MKKIILLPLLTLLMSCHTNSLEEVRRVKVGMSGTELINLLGKPNDVEVNTDDEEWYFTYDDTWTHSMRMRVKIAKDTIVSFYSY